MSEGKITAAKAARLGMLVLAFLAAILTVQAFAAKPAEAVCATYPDCGTSVDDTPTNPIHVIPPNDKFSTATSVPFAERADQKLSADTTLATLESGEPRPYSGTKDCGIYGISNSVWYKFTPAATVYAYDSWFSTYGSKFDTVLGLYTGSSLTSLQQVECSNNNSYPNTSPYADSMRAKLVAGKTYYLQVSGTGGKRSGYLKLEIQAGCVYRTSTSLSPACYL
jgi:hypothetical protein